MAHVPNTPKGLRTRAKLLAAARAVFAREGYVGATMSAVATEASMSLGGLYRYFEDKDDLFSALIADTHDDLFAASGVTEHRLEDDPYATLLDSNRGYLAHYYANRDIMRVLVEAASVEPRFREFWRQMRDRHVDRFVRALETRCQITEVGGHEARTTVEAVACMTEQTAYVWYAQEEMRSEPLPLDVAAQVVTQIWWSAFFGPVPARTVPSP